jgi:hypothetical protein
MSPVTLNGLSNGLKDGYDSDSLLKLGLIPYCGYPWYTHCSPSEVGVDRFGVEYKFGEAYQSRRSGFRGIVETAFVLSGSEIQPDGLA